MSESKQKSIFRDKSLDRLSSPESLNDYIRVTTPSVWLILGAIIIFLVGVCVWGIFGTLDETVPTAAISKNGQVSCFVSENDFKRVSVGMNVEIQGENYNITELNYTPVMLNAGQDDYEIYLLGMESSMWAYELKTDAKISDGIYDGKITVGKITPASFITN